MSVGTVSNILKRKREKEEQYESNVDGDTCRKLCKTSHVELNQSDVGFLSNTQKKKHYHELSHAPVTGP